MQAYPYAVLKCLLAYWRAFVCVWSCEKSISLIEKINNANCFFRPQVFQVYLDQLNHPYRVSFGILKK